MGFSRQEHWSGLPFPLPGDLSDPGIELVSFVSPALAGGFLTTEPPGKPSGKAAIGNNRLYSSKTLFTKTGGWIGPWFTVLWYGTFETFMVNVQRDRIVSMLTRQVWI